MFYFRAYYFRAYYFRQSYIAGGGSAPVVATIPHHLQFFATPGKMTAR